MSPTMLQRPAGLITLLILFVATTIPMIELQKTSKAEDPPTFPLDDSNAKLSMVMENSEMSD